MVIPQLDRVVGIGRPSYGIQPVVLLGAGTCAALHRFRGEYVTGTLKKAQRKARCYDLVRILPIKPRGNRHNCARPDEGQVPNWGSHRPPV
jgi:hypothetical protein